MFLAQRKNHKGTKTRRKKFIYLVSSCLRVFVVIEIAFSLVKRLLGLAYLWVGSENGIQLPVRATWLLYAVLVDLADAVASALDVLFDAISVEMVFRRLYHFTQAYHRGEAVDPVAYLAEHARDLAILKRQRKPRPIAAIPTGP